MIIVTGATGQLGRAVLERLLDRVPAGQLAATTRQPEKTSDLTARGVTVRQADFEDRASLRHAFDGASQVLLISLPSVPADPAPHRAAIEAAKAAGVGRILYTSHMGTSPASLFSAMPSHAQTERDLEASGVPFTSLRNGFYAASAIQLMGQALSTGTITAPEDGPVSWTAHADLAEAAAIALTQEGRLNGITPPLTGPEALDFAGIARVASELTGREITRVTVSDDEWVATMTSYGMPDALATYLLGIFTASRKGEFAAVDPALGQLLGHQPVAFRDVLGATLAS